ncbi:MULTISPECIES: hypothetical protein [unclassified Oleiphilus]|uniref:hypothetical protein n=1 Tax=unclassified Oleiphilus TaxID=2631174 RepID=UPI0007C2D328|nr:MULTISPECIES: hypothetical protein [unclassified Oleiphilus]KZY32531.1 hypothetical protein A3729_07690 [Oleiphilus sp. HI0043]KZZ69787.1 hypothetical protein A3763_12625 [Oleiphilus sp. HI0128]
MRLNIRKLLGIKNRFSITVVASESNIDIGKILMTLVTKNEWETFCELLWRNVFGKGPSTQTQRKITTTAREDAFFNKIIGIIPELALTEVYDSLSPTPGTLMDGGWFIASTKGDLNPLSENGVYVTVTESQPDVFFALYSMLKENVKSDFFLLKIKSSKIETEYRTKDIADIYDIYKFDYNESGQLSFFPSSSDELFKGFKKKNYVSSHNDPFLPNQLLEQEVTSLPSNLNLRSETLFSIFYDRLFYDFYLSKHYEKGNSSDIDCITFKNNAFNLIDIKRKYLSKSGKLGANTEHMPFFESLCGWEKFSCYYVANLIPREQRIDLRLSSDWRYIDMNAFVNSNNIALGRSGQNTNDDQETNMVSIGDFKKIAHGSS